MHSEKKKTKIICTLGPASSSKTILKKMIKAGMNAARLNASHGKIEEFKKKVDIIRSIKDIPIILDTKGPEIRIHVNKPLQVKKGESFKVGFADNNKYPAWFTHDFSPKAKKGSKILINDGHLETVIERKTKNFIKLKALNNYLIENRRGVNTPDIRHELPILTKHDKEALKFALKEELDYIALSFTRNKKDIQNLRKIIGNKIGIIAKIEDPEGVENFDEILKESDGIMVARGDLGVEIPNWKIPLIQKEIIRKCNDNEKIGIVATEMLESMIKNPTPTRAETSDVANAVLDGTDVVMLSGETAKGKYPVKAVETMANIALEVQNRVKTQVQLLPCYGISDGITKAAHEISVRMGIKKIIALTKSGYTALMISRFKSPVEIIALTGSNKIRRRLELAFGVTPSVFDKIPREEKILHSAFFCYKQKLVTKDDVVCFVAGIDTTEELVSNTIQIHRIGDLLKYRSRLNKTKIKEFNKIWNIKTEK